LKTRGTPLGLFFWIAARSGRERPPRCRRCFNVGAVGLAEARGRTAAIPSEIDELENRILAAKPTRRVLFSWGVNFAAGSRFKILSAASWLNAFLASGSACARFKRERTVRRIDR